MALIRKRTSKKKSQKPKVVEDFGMKGAPLNFQQPFYFGFLAAAGALLSITLLRALASASQIFILVTISIFLAMGLNPAVEAIRRRGVSRNAAVALMMLSVLAFVGLFVALLIPPVIIQLRDFLNGAPQLIMDLKNNSTIAKLNADYGFIDTLDKQVSGWVQDGKIVSTAFGGVVGVGKTVLSGTFAALTVLVLTLYFLSSLPKVTEMAYRLAPASRRDRVSKIGNAIIARVGSFVSAQVIIAILAGIFVTILGFIISLPYAAALGMLVFFCGLIPLIGHFIGSSIVTLVALSQSPAKAALALGAYILYVQVENYFITPRIMRKTLSLPALVTILSALIGTSLLGLIGGLLAVPVAAAIMLILDEVVYPKTDIS